MNKQYIVRSNIGYHFIKHSHFMAKNILWTF